MIITQKEYNKLDKLGFKPIPYYDYIIKNASILLLRHEYDLIVEELVNLFKTLEVGDSSRTQARIVLQAAMFEFIKKTPTVSEQVKKTPETLQHKINQSKGDFLKGQTIHTEKGLRYNEGKLRWSLLPLEPIMEVIKVLEFGAKKYAKDNWKKFTKQETDENCYDSMMRHIQAWRGGETHDVETGLPHMAHVMCNALFILWHALNGTK